MLEGVFVAVLVAAAVAIVWCSGYVAYRAARRPRRAARPTHPRG